MSKLDGTYGDCILVGGPLAGMPVDVIFMGLYIGEFNHLDARGLAYYAFHSELKDGRCLFMYSHTTPFPKGVRGPLEEDLWKAAEELRPASARLEARYARAKNLLDRVYRAGAGVFDVMPGGIFEDIGKFLEGHDQ